MKISSLLLLALLLVLSAGPAQAQSGRLTCAISGTGSYVYDDVAHIDYYTLSGAVEQCVSETGEVSAERGVFSGEGFVATSSASGSGQLEVKWRDQRPSTFEVLMTGEKKVIAVGTIPELLALEGEVTVGSYAGSAVAITLLCTPQDTAACLTPGSSTWAFSGTLVLQP